MSEPAPYKRTRVFLACRTCRRLKIKCLTDDSETKPCQRCVRKGLVCEYLPVADEQEQATAPAQSASKSSLSPRPCRRDRHQILLPIIQVSKFLWGMVHIPLKDIATSVPRLGLHTAQLRLLLNKAGLRDILLQITSILPTGRHTPRRPSSLPSAFAQDIATAVNVEDETADPQPPQYGPVDVLALDCATVGNAEYEDTNTQLPENSPSLNAIESTELDTV
ncbi:Haloacid type II [Mycena venus]|uniref:Haloacid type II n=1 Tax=Mycena venus TaxID=2733690 RepID=A0A8H6XJF9_9AGAR|nr:Haloacid type II [Mycena venus]